MKKLELIFTNEDGKNVTYSLDNPKEPADVNEVKNAMQEIIDQDVFLTSGGSVTAIKGARIVDRTVTDLDLELE